MRFPIIYSRMEDVYLLICLGIDANKVGPLVIIAFAARPREPLWIIGHVVDVLLRDDVIDVEDKIRDCVFPKMAILATLACSSSNKFASRCIHALVVHTEVNAPCFGLHEADDLRIVEIRPIFSVLFVRKSS